MKNKPIQSLMLGLTRISIILISNGVVSYAQTNSTMESAMSNSTNSTMANNTTSNSSENPIVKSIDNAIKSIQNEDKDSGKKSLLKAEEASEGKSGLVDAEKRVEAALAALIDGDTNAAISHAEEAMKSIS